MLAGQTSPKVGIKQITQVFFLLLMLFGLAACSTLQPQEKTHLVFLDEYIIPHGVVFQGTQVGGLSGIDYNKELGVYYAISDDRSTINPARFYTFRFDVYQKKIEHFAIETVHFFRMEDGQRFPDIQHSSTQVVDPESIRYNPMTHEIVWTSEGERIVSSGNKSILIDPSIFVSDLSGKVKTRLTIPEQFKMTEHKWGSRRNGTFEGSAFTPDFKTLFVSMEDPLYQDSEPASLNTQTPYWTRIIRFDYLNKKANAQYAYPLDAVIYPPLSKQGSANNGISEILALDDQHLLVLERSYSEGWASNSIRIYLADLSHAENIQDIPSLKKHKLKNPITKKLVIDLKELNRHIDNLEGITFGPILPNGNPSLILIADDNFNAKQSTQILLFEVLHLKP